MGARLINPTVCKRRSCGNQYHPYSAAMQDPRTWTLLESDAAAVRELRRSGVDPASICSIQVRFTGTNVASEHFRRDMATTGWEIIDLEVTSHGAAIVMEWDDTSEDHALRALADRIRKIEDYYGLAYDGWSISLACAGRSSGS